jgi:signal transduction histidine kinase
LQHGDATATAELLDGLKVQTRRMAQMLSDLLDYARIGRKPVAIQPTDSRALITAIVRSLPRPAGFEVEIAGDWPELETVGPALDLVLRNLLDNAIKHHDRPDGRVVIAACRVEDGLAIELRDDGPGIPLEHQAAVFLPFRKLKEDTLGDAEGSGMGLAFVRKTAGAMGASLSLESDPELRRGTTFKLGWPGRPVQ